MADLGHIPAVGKLAVPVSANRVTPGAWLVTFPPELMPRSQYEVWHASLVGPGGYALLYLDDTLYGVIQNGRLNEYAPSICLLAMPGQTITIHWSIATGAAPVVVMFMRTPEVGRI